MSGIAEQVGCHGARIVAVSILVLTLLGASLPPPAEAAERETRLLSITKTTIYGALLGGILGLASALVVRDGYEDDAVRWGVVVGAFGGFAYGVASPEEDEWDDLSLLGRHQRAIPFGSVLPQALAADRFPDGFRFGNTPSLFKGTLPAKPEVRDGRLEEESEEEENS